MSIATPRSHGARRWWPTPRCAASAWRAAETPLVDRAALDTHLMPVLRACTRSVARCAATPGDARSPSGCGGGDREGLAHRPGAGDRRRHGRRRRRRDRAYRPLRQPAHRSIVTANERRRSASSTRSTAPSSAQRQHPVRRRRRVRPGAEAASRPTACTPRGPVGLVDSRPTRTCRARHGGTISSAMSPASHREATLPRSQALPGEVRDTAPASGRRVRTHDAASAVIPP